MSVFTRLFQRKDAMPSRMTAEDTAGMVASRLDDDDDRVGDTRDMSSVSQPLSRSRARSPGTSSTHLKPGAPFRRAQSAASAGSSDSDASTASRHVNDLDEDADEDAQHTRRLLSASAPSFSSFASTPPTSLAGSAEDGASSGVVPTEDADPKPRVVGGDGEATIEQSLAESGRARRTRKEVPTYNLKKLTGLSRKSKLADGGVPVRDAIPSAEAMSPADSHHERATRRRTISGDTLIGETGDRPSTDVNSGHKKTLDDGVAALDLEWSVKKLPRSKSMIGLRETSNKASSQKFKTTVLQTSTTARSTRSSGMTIESAKKQLGNLGKRSRQALETNLTRASRELRNLADTMEFAKIDDKPVVWEVWANGKLVTGDEPPKKKARVEEEPKPQDTPEEEAETTSTSKSKRGKKPKQKLWLSRGLYAGQDLSALNRDWFKYFPDCAKQGKELPPFDPKGFMPLPMWHGQRLLSEGRDFKLPYDVCSPLPPGQPKPDEWRKTSSNRFVGDAAAAWKKSKLFESFSSKCICDETYGCDDDCQNRIMLYECDDTNCAVGKDRCGNRSFADLQERRKLGNQYRIGVEVIKTVDRGYGVRSNRSFDAHQIIVEYTGEIITEAECDRRMNEDYKKNECYYLMSFDQNMIIDATKGSIARFVNHSCRPNCRMVKWIVGGKPRMALFAGDKPIKTGEELTYDYNFDPFSAKNVQECRCGSDNCRGVLGPRNKDQKPIKDTIKDVLKAGVRAGKRKLKELLGAEDDEEADNRGAKKRKMKEAVGVKRSKSTTGKAVAKGAAAAKAVTESVTRRVPNVSKLMSRSTKSGRKSAGPVLPSQTSSRNSSLTLVGKGSDSPGSKQRKSIGGESSKQRKSVGRESTTSSKPASLKKAPPKKQKRHSMPSLGNSKSTGNRITKKSTRTRQSTGIIKESTASAADIAPASPTRNGIATRASSGSPYKSGSKSMKFFEDQLTDVLATSTSTSSSAKRTSLTSQKKSGKGKTADVDDDAGDVPSPRPTRLIKTYGTSKGKGKERAIAAGRASGGGSTTRLVSGEEW